VLVLAVLAPVSATPELIRGAATHPPLVGSHRDRTACPDLPVGPTN
jgi:hypothetical protein